MTMTIGKIIKFYDLMIIFGNIIFMTLIGDENLISGIGQGCYWPETGGHAQESNPRPTKKIML